MSKADPLLGCGDSRLTWSRGPVERRRGRATLSGQVEEVTVLYLHLILIDDFTHLIVLQLRHNVVLSLLKGLLIQAVKLQDVVSAGLAYRVGHFTGFQLKDRIADFLGKLIRGVGAELSAFVR